MRKIFPYKRKTEYSRRYNMSMIKLSFIDLQFIQEDNLLLAKVYEGVNSLPHIFKSKVSNEMLQSNFIDYWVQQYISGERYTDLPFRKILTKKMDAENALDYFSGKFTLPMIDWDFEKDIQPELGKKRTIQCDAEVKKYDDVPQLFYFQHYPYAPESYLIYFNDRKLQIPEEDDEVFVHIDSITVKPVYSLPQKKRFGMKTDKHLNITSFDSSKGFRKQFSANYFWDKLEVFKVLNVNLQKKKRKDYSW